MSWCGFSSCLSINFTDLDKIRRALRGRKTGRSWKEILYCLWEPHWARVWDLWPKPSGIRLMDDDQRLKSVQDLHRFTEGVHFDVKKQGSLPRAVTRTSFFYSFWGRIVLHSPFLYTLHQKRLEKKVVKTIAIWNVLKTSGNWIILILPDQVGIFIAASPRHWHVCSCFSLVWTGF